MAVFVLIFFICRVFGAESLFFCFDGKENTIEYYVD